MKSLKSCDDADTISPNTSVLLFPAHAPLPKSNASQQTRTGAVSKQSRFASTSLLFVLLEFKDLIVPSF